MDAQAIRDKLRDQAKIQALANQPPSRTMLPEETLRVAYQGEPGAYSEQAAIQYFETRDQQVHLHPCASFEEMVEALDQNLVERVALPVENLLAGTIHKNLDLITRYGDITIVGELDFHVRHCLMAMKGVKLGDIKVVKSHHMALAQCSEYLRSNGLTQEVAYDTAGSAKLIHKTKTMEVAAVASKRAAQIYDLNILADDIQDKCDNYTRFLILSKEKVPYVPGTPSKTSLVFAMNNSPGALHRALSVFAATQIDLTKLESRHLHSAREALMNKSEQLMEDSSANRWDYVFYVDIARHEEEKSVAVALDHLREITAFCRILGSYPRHVSTLHD